jgi:DNA-binding transcriptional regulator YdaS (Cro superfamily)
MAAGSPGMCRPRGLLGSKQMSVCARLGVKPPKLMPATAKCTAFSPNKPASVRSAGRGRVEARHGRRKRAPGPHVTWPQTDGAAGAAQS